MKRTLSLCITIVTACLLLSCGSNDKGRVDNSSDSLIKPLPVVSSPNPYTPVDVSPMDMTYFPENYPIMKMDSADMAPPLARVIYSRPHLAGRKLFVNIQHYNEPWRLGANESTELELYNNAIIQGKKIPPGRYVMYCIPEPDKWTIILNTNTESWGLKPDSSKDLVKFVIPVTTNNRPVEYYTMIFKKSNKGADLIMAWDQLEARLPFEF